MAKITEFEKALIHRDGDTKQEASRHRQEASEILYDMLAEGADYDDIEDMMACEYGLEMDYILDLI